MAFWVVNPKYNTKPTRLPRLVSERPDLVKSYAEQKMEMFDKLPRAARAAVHEYGRLQAALACRSRKAADKVAAVVRSYQEKLKRSAVDLDR